MITQHLFTKKNNLNVFSLLILCLGFLIVTSCSSSLSGSDPAEIDEDAATLELNREMSELMALYSQAMVKNDPELVLQMRTLLAKWDNKYQSDLSAAFAAIEQKHQEKVALNQTLSQTRFSSDVSFPLLNDLPLEQDGAVYLSGGGQDIVGSILDFVSPLVTEGRYYHGAALDKDKFDPTNLESNCFQSAGEKGASYETPINWMGKVNVAVLHPNQPLIQSQLDSSQAVLDFYCDPANTNMQYGFFKDYINLFNVVTKDDTYNWYCTKVVWHVYKSLGIDIDSNTTAIDWTSSGMYEFIKVYYGIRYWYSASKTKTAINNYLQNVRRNLVLAEEIYFSPFFTKRYEKVRY
jgi:hypothetical protein